MRNIIRKVLKEEFKDLDWIKDTVTTKLSGDEDWILVNDVDPKSLEESHQIQQYLFNLGYSWGTDDSKPLKNFHIHSIYHFGQHQGYNKGQIYYAGGFDNSQIRTSKRDIASGKYMVYYWSDLKPKTIEESDDFEWINEPRNNPLDGLRLTTPMGRSGTGLTIKDDGGTHVTVISSNGSSEYHRGTVKNFIKMGVWLPKKSMNEADDLDWIRNTTLNKWDYFGELIKHEPEINIEKNEDGEWVDFKDNKNRPYFGSDLYVDYELEEDIKSNPLDDFLNAVSQHIEVTFQGYDYEEDEDYWDFLKLKKVLEKANGVTQ